MAVDQRIVQIPHKPEDAMRACAQALARAGFKDINAVPGAMMVTGQKRAVGQWTKSQLTITIAGAPKGGSTLTFIAQASAQSLVSMLSSPASRMIESVIANLSSV